MSRKLRTGATLGLLMLALVLLLAVALVATGCGASQPVDGASTTTTALSSTSAVPVTSSTTTLAQAHSLDSLAPADVVRTFFTSKDATVRYQLMFQSTENLDPSMDGRGRAAPLDISNLVVAGPLTGEPLTDPTRPNWKERLLFGVSYRLDSASPLGEAPGQKELCVVVARQDSQSPWKILILNQGPPPKELPAAQQKKLDQLSLADVVRTYFESFDFDTQIYLSAPHWQETLVEALGDPAQKGDIAVLVVGTPYTAPDQPSKAWPIQRALRVTYKLLVARDYPGGNHIDSPGGQIRFVSVGEQREGGPWKILGVGTGP